MNIHYFHIPELIEIDNKLSLRDKSFVFRYNLKITNISH